MTGLTFVSPLYGLEPLTEFTLDQLEGTQGLYTLKAANAPDRRMFVLDPGVYVPGYQPELTDDQAGELGLSSPAEAKVFVIANPRDGAPTVNLLAPIVVNCATGRCAQFILEGQDWPLQEPLSVSA